MDISETYIKMRLAAIPDLGMGTPMGFSINWQSEAILIDEKGDWYYSTKDKATQLERQDQLQEMVKNGWFINLGRLWYAANLNDEISYLAICSTWEQLWLAFVMKEKFNKAWNGKRWVKGE